MKDYFVFIVDVSKLNKKEKVNLFDWGVYMAKIEEASYEKVTNEVDRIQEEELIK